jgi:5-hydroxyisourate hydrolase-like protein (transthyretin family)
MLIAATVAVLSILATFLYYSGFISTGSNPPPSGNNEPVTGILTVNVKYQTSDQPIPNVPVKLFATVDNFNTGDISTVSTDSNGIAKFDLSNVEYCTTRTAARIIIDQTSNYSGFEQTISKPVCQTRTVTATLNAQVPPAPKPIISGHSVSVTTQNWQGHINAGLLTNIDINFQQSMPTVNVFSRILNQDGTRFASTGQYGRNLVSSVNYANNWYLLEDVSAFTAGSYIYQLYIDSPYYTYTLNIPITVNSSGYFTLSNFNNSSGNENMEYKTLSAMDMIKLSFFSFFASQDHGMQYQGQMVLNDN